MLERSRPENFRREHRMLKILGSLILVVPAFAAAGLLWSHLSIRTIEPELPSIEQILAVGADSADLPVAAPAARHCEPIHAA